MLTNVHSTGQEHAPAELACLHRCATPVVPGVAPTCFGRVFPGGDTRHAVVSQQLLLARGFGIECTADRSPLDVFARHTANANVPHNDRAMSKHRCCQTARLADTTHMSRHLLIALHAFATRTP